MHKIIVAIGIIVVTIITFSYLHSKKAEDSRFWENYRETEKLLDSVKTLRELRESPVDSLTSNLVLPLRSGNTY
jgi:hypothetical protein